MLISFVLLLFKIDEGKNNSSHLGGGEKKERKTEKRNREKERNREKKIQVCLPIQFQVGDNC